MGTHIYAKETVEGLLANVGGNPMKLQPTQKKPEDFQQTLAAGCCSFRTSSTETNVFHCFVFAVAGGCAAISTNSDSILDPEGTSHANMNEWCAEGTVGV